MSMRNRYTRNTKYSQTLSYSKDSRVGDAEAESKDAMQCNAETEADAYAESKDAMRCNAM